MTIGDFARLRTAHGTFLARDHASGEALSVTEADTGPAHSVLLAYLPRARENACFVLAPQAARLRIQPTLEGAGIVPLGLAARTAGTLSLYDPDTAAWLCAAPPSGVPPRGRVAASARAVAAYERFMPSAVPTIYVPAALLQLAARLEAMLAVPFGLPLIRAAEPQDGPLLQAICRLASFDDMERLAEALLASPEDCRRLAALFPNDIMAEHGLPVLADWLRHRTPPPPEPAAPRGSWVDRLRTPSPAPAPPPPIPPQLQVLPPQLDPLATLGATGAYVSLPHAATALARRLVTPRKTLCVIATARNESLYILEWLAYHRAIGAEATFLYTNDNDDGSDPLLAALARAGALHWTRSEIAPGGNAQGKAYGHALGLQPAILDYRWALIVDIDEYLVFDPALFRSAPDFLRLHETSPSDAIALNWVVHSSNAEPRWRDAPIADRFPHRVSEAGPHIKTLCRPRQFIHAKPHHPVTYRGLPATFRAANLAPHVSQGGPHELSLSTHPSDEFAWISHYFYKSPEEFLWKWSRNRGDHATLRAPSNAVLTADFVQNFMQQYEARVPARAGPSQCAPNWAAELAALKALPGVADAWETVKRTYAERIRTIVPMFVTAPGLRDAGDAGRAFLATLGL